MIVSDTSSLYVIFFSDDSINGGGFNATYFALEGIGIEKMAASNEKVSLNMRKLNSFR